MRLKVTAPSRIHAGLGWPRLARWGRSLGWPADLSVPRETPELAADGEVVVSPPLTQGPSDDVGPGEATEGAPSFTDDGVDDRHRTDPSAEADLSDLAHEEPAAVVSPRLERLTDVEGEPPPATDSPADGVESPIPVVVPRETSEDIVDDHRAVSDDNGSPQDQAVSADVSRETVAEHQVTRPPGPRRAKFDRDEFDNGDVEEAQPRTPAAVSPPAPGLPRPAATRVFVVANQKGGVGKTTTSVNLAAGLALGGLNVLVLDLDPQGNASTALGVEHSPGTPGTYEVLIEGSPIADNVVTSPEAPHLQVLPATIDLAGAEIQLVSMVARENRLRKALRAYLSDHPVDYVFLDCPPSLGLITLNALVAASEILIPIQCEYYALEGVSQLVRTINLVKGELNEDLEVSTVLLTMYDARTRLAAQVADEVRSYFAEQTLPTVIPRSVRISEAPSYGQTVLTYHPDSAGAVSYLQAAREIAHRGAKDPASDSDGG